ncbi:MAG TPA: VOC family protein [Acetobacteraceae bacterium]|jgi:catechol 2,3-dioxygenase-like lactoylglutathione lyase family enzyme|nr:VOC family protein [Acetobacteraceae bacterium]
MNLNQVTLPACDVAASARFYRGMGFTQIVDTAHYARFECPDGESTFSVHHAPAVPPDTGTVIYFEVEQLDDKVRALQALGFEFFHPPTDERWLWREARLKDPSGNVICLFWGGENRRFPPWRIAGA